MAGEAAEDNAVRGEWLGRRKGAKGNFNPGDGWWPKWARLRLALTTLPLGQRDLPYLHWEFSDPTSGDRLRVVPERGGLIGS